MNIIQNNEDSKGYFKAVSDGKQAGLMTYSWAGSDKFIIDHTEVDAEFKGQGVGEKMIMAAVEYARKNNLKILPLCPFAASVFKKNTDIQDVKL